MNTHAGESALEIRVSYGTAIVLGLLTSKQLVPPTTAYLLWDPGCRGSCSFCPRGEMNSGQERLSRVVWPVFPLADVLERLAPRPALIKRICLQTGWAEESFQGQLLELVGSLQRCGLPLCVTLHPAQMELAEGLLSRNVDQIGMGLDAASPETYKDHKKRDWTTDWPAIVRLMERFPDRIEVHLIYGLGDSEREFMQTMDAIFARRAQVALFALTPTTREISRLPAPSLSSYRRIQAFHRLRRKMLTEFSRCSFREGVLVDFGMPRERLEEALSDGKAFQTCGCEDCNRPFYNERPGGVMYNFPRPLTAPEAKQAMAEMELRSWL